MLNGKYRKKYAMYKGDTFLDMGTLLQLSLRRNVKLRTIQFYLTPTYQKRRKDSKNSIALVEV